VQKCKSAILIYYFERGKKSKGQKEAQGGGGQRGKKNKKIVAPGKIIFHTLTMLQATFWAF